MGDLQEQLAFLRRKIARIDKKYADLTDSAWTTPELPSTPPEERARPFIEEWMSGEVVETPHGTHFETVKVYERHRRHGSMDISNLFELPPDLLGQLSEQSVGSCHPERWAFLDTETTGLAGGTGTYAFLVGVGRICPEGFRLRQFFMRDYAEEASLLYALSQHLAEFDVLVTYNGKTYDQPLLETRFRMCRARPPFERLQHLDLLHGARRLWKLRLESCRLVDLENQILGVEREGDLPGEMIPYVYFEYLRTSEAFRLVPIFHHNAIDILTLACLTGIVPLAFRSPDETAFAHGADLLGLARWFLRTDRRDKCLELMRRAVNLGLSDELMFRTLWDIGCLEKKGGNETAAIAIFADLTCSKNPFRIQAYVELAKYYEHREANHDMALDLIRSALAIQDTPELRRRECRLRRKSAIPRPRRLL